MATDEEKQSLLNTFQIEEINKKIDSLENAVSCLKKANAENERDIGRWRTGVLIIAALGGIVTWILNTLNNLKPFVK